MFEQALSLGSRILSMLLDYVVMIFVSAIFWIPSTIEMIFSEGTYATDDLPFGWGIYLALMGFVILMNKDAIRGRSIAKRQFGTRVVVHNTNLTAGPFRSFLRNITYFFWPIEGLVTLFSPTRRIGDLIAGTRVDVYDENEEKPSIKLGELVISILCGYALMFGFLELMLNWLG